MTQVVFELGDTPSETGVYVNPDVRWTLKEIAEEILRLGEEEFITRYCYYRSKSRPITDSFKQFESGNFHERKQSITTARVRNAKSNDRPVIETSTASRKAKYNVKVGNKIFCENGSKVEMVYQVLSYLIKENDFSPESINEQTAGRYFNKFDLLKKFPRNYDIDEMKKELGNDSSRYSLKKIINSEGALWVPCSQWIPKNTDLFISDMKKWDNDLVINEI